MSVNDFIRTREKDWKRLQSLLEQINRRGRRQDDALTGDEVQELGLLYRAAVSDLAASRRDYPDQRVTGFLNQLVSRAHNDIYEEDVNNVRAGWVYLRQRVPQIFRQTWPFTLAAFLLFMIPAVVGFRLALTQPEIASPLGLEYIRDTLSSQQTWTDIPVEQRPYASAFIMSNNIRVALLAFGGGMVFGLFTVYVLAMNGLIIGAVLGLAFHYGLGWSLVDFIFAHGVVELSVIFISGGAGLQLGWALINPGPYTRRDALAIAARRAVALALIAIPLLVGAGIIEGFVSPSGLPFAVKALVGLGYAALMYGYLLLAGRSSTGGRTHGKQSG
jgi:uncharacterized membrane protein SpoIIM required for sporulation